MDEISIDGFHEKEDRLYQAMTLHDNQKDVIVDPTTQGLLAAAMQQDFPEVEIAVQTSVDIPDPFVLSVGDKKYKQFGKWVGKDFFQLFSYEVIEGIKANFLEDQQAIVVSEQLAKKLFPNESPIGKTIEWNILQFNGVAAVSGVYQIPKNATHQFDFLLPYGAYQELMKNNIHWGNFNAMTYVLLHEQTDIATLNKRLPAYIQEKAEWERISLFLTPFKDRYLNSRYENGKQAGGRIDYVKLFSIIALFILLIACINFMNLSTAKSTQRLKEVGVRKTIGAGRSSLMLQYLMESSFIAFLALLLAIGIVYLVLPSFNGLTGKELALIWDPKWIVGLISATAITGILAGSYPAFYISSFQPVSVLKGKLRGTSSAAWLRKSLVVLQFALSIILMVSVIVVYQQIQFIQNKNLGYDKENIITFPKEGMATTKLETFLQAIKKIPGIINASSTNHPIIKGASFTTGLSWEGKNPAEEIRFANMTVYYDLIETLGLQLKEGRSFSREFGTEDNNLILNETAIKVMGLSNPIGKQIDLWGEKATIIGVVKDFHNQSLHTAIEPSFFRLNDQFLVTIMAKIEAGKEQTVVSALQDFYKEFNPGYSFNYTFLDASFNEQYQSESIIGSLSTYFAGLAILISCLGLFGLVAFSAQRRQKEIGIRKVLGASIFNIIQMLSMDFTKMVLIAIVIALPISNYIANEWLSSFAFHIDLQPWYYAAAGLGALLIAWLTMSFQTTRAALANPVDSLRDE